MAPHSSTLAWKIPWTEEPGGLQSMGSLRVRHDWVTSLSLLTFMHWRRKWQPTPVFLPGESQGRGEPCGLPSMGSHRVGHDWSDLAAEVTKEQNNFLFHINNWICFLRRNLSYFTLPSFSFYKDQIIRSLNQLNEPNFLFLGKYWLAWAISNEGLI